MKPFQILTYLLIILFALALIALMFPKGNIFISDTLKLKFISFNDIFFTKKIEYANISNIISKQKKNIEISENNKINNSNNTYSLISSDNTGVIADSLLKIDQKIEYPGNDSTILYSFFNSMFKHEGVIRVLHYGDSQIEGDRISSYIRRRLQSKFGGGGIGLFSVVDPGDVATSLNKSHSENWKRYTLYGKRDTSVHHKKYCVLESFSRFAPVRNDSIFVDTANYSAWITIKNLNQYKKNIKQCRILCGNNKRPVSINFYNKNVQEKSEILSPNSNLNIIEWNFEETPEEITIKFQGKDSPDIYAIALDGNTGIAVDNIPMRGSAGLDFNKMDLELLKNSFEKLNVKLLILEFGVNVVPNEVEDYGYYETWFYSQLKSLKRIKPDISIIVIGVSDMSKKVGDHYESFSNIEKIRNAQRNASFKAGCAFWDLYKAMGGKNSMPSWVLANPTLASKDFTHFNYEGAKIIAEMFYNSLFFEYNEFKKTKAN